ncbi:homoserine kinase [bacterium]|nr:homoserine kinase [bacterium]
MMLVSRVPATTANLGVGFDTLGLALKLYNTFEVKISHLDNIEVVGEGKEELVKRENNSFIKTIEYFYRLHNMTPPHLVIKISSNIPICRGLGSSASAIVAGLMVANALTGKNLPKEVLLKYAVELERHPDNVTPAMLGGCTISLVSNGEIIVKKIPFPEEIAIIVAVPQFNVETELSRKLIPDCVSLDTTIRGLAKMGMFVTSLLTKDFKHLPIILDDELHEPYRANYIPNYKKIKEELISSGALGVMISGSGPSMVILSERDKVKQLKEDIKAVLFRNNIVSKVFDLEIDNEGALLEVKECIT